MKSNTAQVRKKLLNLAKNYSIKWLFIKVVYFISGIIISHGAVFGRYFPFGLSLSASVPGRMLAPTVVGSALGYLFPLRAGMAVRYISSLVSIAAIRWALSDLAKIKNHVLYTPAIVFVSSLITGIAVNSPDGFDARDISVSVLESFIAAGAAYFLDRTFKFISRKNFHEITQQDFVCASISFGVILMSLGGVAIGGISLGRIAAIILVLVCAYCFGVCGGSVSGIASGVIFSLPSFGLTYTSGCYAFGGMIAGLMSAYGKIGVCASFLFAGTLVSFQSGDITKMVGGLYESVFACIVFTFIPKSFFEKINEYIPNFLNGLPAPDSKVCVNSRTEILLDTISKVPAIVEKALASFYSQSKNDFKLSCMSSVQGVCRGCCMCSFCWSSVNRKNTESNLYGIIESACHNNAISTANFTDEFFRRCHKSKDIVNAVIKEQKNIVSVRAESIHLQSMQKAAYEQLSGISALIKNTENDFYNNSRINKSVYSKIKKIFERGNIELLNLKCAKNKYEKMLVQAETKNIYKNKLSDAFIKEISCACKCSFNEPVITDFENAVRINLCEEKTFCAEFGISSHSCNNAGECGDTCVNFEDGAGKFNLIISDGMGTGSGAAAESRAASELMKNFIRAGMNFESAVKFVNSFLLMKKQDESSATIDALSLNLFSGEAKFLKAGAPPTFIIQNGKTQKIDMESLPVGILNSASMAAHRQIVQGGDFILMVSDGVTDLGCEWIEKFLISGEYSTAQELARLITNEAVRLRRDGYDDDITAAAVKILKNN